MDKCRLCQQIFNNLKIIYSSRIKSITQFILEHKGFKDSWDIDNDLALCESCLQNLENFVLFWDKIPEAKEETTDILGKLEEAKPNSVIRVEQKLPDVHVETEKLHGYEPSTNTVAKLNPNKLHKKIELCKSTNMCINEELIQKRTSPCPQLFKDFNSDNAVANTRDNSVHLDTEASSAVSFSNLPHMALLRLKNGQDIGTLAELKSKEFQSHIRILCHICRQIFHVERTFQLHLKRHILTEAEQTDDISTHYFIHCKLCDKPYCSNRAVRNHYKAHHLQERPFKCFQCESDFQSKHGFQYHLFNKHKGEKRFHCKFCQKRPYKCKLCPSSFTHKRSLKYHQRVKHLKGSNSNSTILTDKFKKPTITSKQFLPPVCLVERENYDSVMKEEVDFKESVRNDQLKGDISQSYLSPNCDNTVQLPSSSKRSTTPKMLFHQENDNQSELNTENISESILPAFKNLEEENITNPSTGIILRTENSAQTNFGAQYTLPTSVENKFSRLTDTSETAQELGTSQPNLFNNPNEAFTHKPATTITRSLLKPVVKHPIETHLSLTNSAPEQQTVFPDKPIINKVEILPPYENLATLPNPLTNSTNDYKYQCSYCNKCFKYTSSLSLLLRTHTGENLYKCNLCPSSFADPSNYRKHKIQQLQNADEAFNLSPISTTAVQGSPPYSTESDSDIEVI